MKLSNTIKIELIKSKSVYHIVALLYILFTIISIIGSIFESNQSLKFVELINKLNKDFIYSFFFFAIVHISIDFKTGGIGKYFLSGKKRSKWILLKAIWLFLIGMLIYVISFLITFIVFRYKNVNSLIIFDKNLFQNIFSFPILLFATIIYSFFIVVLLKNIVVSLLFFIFYPIIESLIIMLITMFSIFTIPKLSVIGITYLPFINLIKNAENCLFLNLNTFLPLIVLLTYLCLFTFFIFYRIKKIDLV